MTTGPDVLLDVSRSIWRASTGRLPTGIDRVCLAYVAHFGSRARAVVQRPGLRRILSAQTSAALFALLRAGGPGFWQRAARLAARAIVTPWTPQDGGGAIYLNVGHTGLDDPDLAGWVKRLNVRPVFMVHDLIPITHPQYCREGEATRHAQRMRTILTLGTGVIGNSRATLDALASFAEMERLALPAQLAAWLGIARPLRDAPRPPDSHPYFVTLGTIEGRKNHLLLLNVWQRLIARHGIAAPHLYVIGQRGWECEQVIDMLDRAPALKGHVTELAHCSDGDLAAYLAGARALLFPSFAEGFGMPLVEALAQGTPVIASDLPVFKELAGNIPDYADPIDGLGWMAAIEDYASEDSQRRAAQMTRLEGYAAPTWAQHFARVDAWLTTLQ